jgi:hypothetical protein
VISGLGACGGDLVSLVAFATDVLAWREAPTAFKSVGWGFGAGQHSVTLGQVASVWRYPTVPEGRRMRLESQPQPARAAVPHIPKLVVQRHFVILRRDAPRTRSGHRR